MKELATALNAFQAELVKVGKDAVNPHFRNSFASLAHIMQRTQPVLTRHGLSVMQLLDNLDGKPALTTIVYHTSGESERSTIPLILAKADPQGVGSAVTYMRRYGYAAALQIVIDEDDDGEQASDYNQDLRDSTSGRVVSPATTGEATAAQKQSIKKHLDKIGISMEKSNQYLKETYGVETPLTRASAATVIDAIIMGDK